MIRRPHNRRRLAVSAAITLFWLAMMALLVRNYVLPLRASAAALPLASGQLAGNWRDFEEWMSLRVGEKSDGVSYTLVEQREDGGDFLAANRTWLDLDLLGARHAFRLETVALLDPQFALQCATVVLRIDDTPLQFKTLVTPRRLLYRLEFEGQVHVGAQPLKGPVSLLEAVRPLVAQRLELAVGRVYRLPVFDSTWSLRQGVAEIRVEALDDIPFQGQMVQAYRVVTQLGPHASTAWVTGVGIVLRREFSNIVMERVNASWARRRFKGIDAPILEPQVAPEEFEAATGREGSLANEIGPLNLLLRLFGPKQH